MTVVVIDTETSGFGHMKGRDDCILQIGFAWRNRNGQLKCWEYLANPGEEYLDRADPIALQVNNLTKERIRQQLPAFAVADKFRRHLEMVGATELRAYNMAFDRPFLEKDPWNVKMEWGPCIMLDATPVGERWPKLSVACAKAGIDTTGPLHSAGHDARIAYLLMEQLEARKVNKYCAKCDHAIDKHQHGRCEECRFSLDSRGCL